MMMASSSSSIFRIDLSIDQLNDIKQVLENPLTSRQVMVPITSKAFVRGKLQPILATTTSTSTTSSSNNTIHHHRGGEEQVWLKIQKEKKLMTRSEASRLIQESIDKRTKQQQQHRPTSSTTTTTLQKQSSNQQTSKAILKQETTNTQDGKKTAAKNVLPTATKKKIPSSSSSLMSPLPLFDIREEYTDDGKEVHAEAVNVTHQLRILQQQLEDGDESKSNEAETVLTFNNNDNNQEPLSSPSNDVPIIGEEFDDEPPSRLPVSDAEYQALSARLEELARLEEAAEAQEQENQENPKFRPTKRVAPVAVPKGKSQKSGWVKGFLVNNSNKKEKSSTKTTKQNTTTQPIVAEVSKPSATPSSNNFVDGETATQVRKVRFQNQVDDVASDYVPPSSPVSPPEPLPPPSKLPPSKPFDSNIFTGIVRERPIVSSSTDDEPKSNRMSERGSPSSAKATTTTELPKKKLSRFAMERRQHHQ